MLLHFFPIFTWAVLSSWCRWRRGRSCMTRGKLLLVESTYHAYVIILIWNMKMRWRTFAISCSMHDFVSSSEVSMWRTLILHYHPWNMKMPWRTFAIHLGPVNILVSHFDVSTCFYTCHIGEMARRSIKKQAVNFSDFDWTIICTFSMINFCTTLFLFSSLFLMPI